MLSLGSRNRTDRSTLHGWARCTREFQAYCMDGWRYRALELDGVYRRDRCTVYAVPVRTSIYR